MVDIKHTEAIDPGITAFDQVIQDIREIRANQESRSLLHRRARSETDSAPEESLPLFLSTSEDQDWPSADQGTDFWQQPGRRQNARQQDARQHDATRQDTARQDTRYQDVRYQEDPYQDTPYQDTRYHDAQHQDAWLHDALESDRERVKAIAGPTILKRVFKAGLLTTTIVAALAALFALQDGRTLISHASASLAAVLPGFSASIGRPAPASAKPQVAEASLMPVAPVVPAAAPAAAPTREAISVAYQSALQSQPEMRQPPAPPPAPVPAVRRIDPDELATLLKRAQSLLDMGDLSGARLLLERAADAHEAKAAFILAQTYDPAVIGTPDARSIAPDPEAAKRWYQKAAQFGSQEAQVRLAQMQN